MLMEAIAVMTFKDPVWWMASGTADIPVTRKWEI
jgi:hypothetical protein